MSNKTIIALIVIILVIVGFILWRSPLHAPSNTENNATTTGSVMGDETSVITANHFYDPKTSTHTLEGSITLPTPCDSLSYTVATDGSSDTDITVAFTSVSTTEICTQVLAQKVFHVAFVGAENATIHATLNGQARELQLSAQGNAIEKL